MKLIRLRNMSDSGPCTRRSEFWVQTRKPFDTWVTRAVLFNYNDARKYIKFLRESMT